MKNTFTDPLLKRPPISRNLRALIMRISQVYILILTTAIVSVAKPGSGQSIETTEVKLEIQNEPLTKVFSEIEKQTDFLFSWAPGKVQGLGRVSLANGKYTVKEALELVLNGKGLSYRQEENYVLVFGEARNGTANLQYSDSDINASGKTPQALIAGTVKDASTQEPLAGVNIIVKGTANGTTTDFDGKFVINVDHTDILVFSFIGYLTLEESVNDRTLINVAMKEDVAILKEVVVNAGYWQVNKKESTGNISRVDAESITKQPVANPLQALQGRMAGVDITQNTGVPGGSFDIQIRGQNSLRNTSSDNGNLPLFIVDGVPFTSSSISSVYSYSDGVTKGGTSPLNMINPNDIASVEILKDADATAIYGSRGANGVVLITTKKGSVGKTVLDFNVYTGVANAVDNLDLLNTEQYLEMRNEAFQNDETLPTPNDYDVNGTWNQNQYTDWEDLLMGGTAQVTNIQLSASGGRGPVQFSIGGGYYEETTVFPGDFADQKGSVRLAVSHISENKKLRINLSTNYVSNKNSLPSGDPSLLTVTLPPNAPAVYDEFGNLNWENDTWTNPFAQYHRTYQLTSQNLISNASVGYEVIPNLNLGSTLGYTTMHLNELEMTPQSVFSTNETSNKRMANLANNKIETWIAEPKIDYILSIGKGKLSLLAGMTFQQSIKDGVIVRGSNFLSDGQLKNVASAPNISASQSYTEYKYNAAFSRLNYNWDGKYILNITGRRDGSSRFGPSKRFSNFGAIGVAWIFSNTNFVKQSLSFLSFAKLRASYGTTGNDQIPDYGYLDTHQTSGVTYNGNSILYPSRLINSNYSWETNKKIEAAIELSFLNDRISLNSAWYSNRSSNQLVGYPLPSITGQSLVQFNLPAVIENTGIEIELMSTNIQLKTFTWSMSGNLTVPRNKLIDYPNINGSSYVNTYAVGESLGIKKVYNYLGVDSETGLYVVEDIDGSGTISSTLDRSFLKSIDKKYYGGLQNSFRYKGWQLDIFLHFVKQTRTNYLHSINVPPGRMSNQPTIVMNRWQHPGDISDIQKFSAGSVARASYNNIYNYGSNAITDASFLRLKNVSLSFSFNDFWIQKLKLSQFRIYLQGQNLLTLTDFYGMDPESGAIGLPPLRMMTAGIQLTF